MSSNPLPVNSSRLGGCTLTGAISVTSHIRDAVTIIHGPKGCSHHNLSLLHASWLDNEQVVLPTLISTGLSETEVVFGGEESLRMAIAGAAARPNVRGVFVLSTCIVETIGDDISAVCSGEYDVPVVPIPSAGFLGGTFQDGMINALTALAGTATRCEKNGGINIIGEMNLEYEVEENYQEIVRLLSLLDLTVNVRFIHNMSWEQLHQLGAAQLNILRSPALAPVGEFLKKRFGTPYIATFPHGLSGTLSFIREVAAVCGKNGPAAAREEYQCQEEMLGAFSDLKLVPVSLDRTYSGDEEILAAEELAAALDLRMGAAKTCARLPVSAAVGTAGTRRMLHRWRRAIHA
jgi:nitrogenase molybdenum-iron protein alpha/beta subunit